MIKELFILFKISYNKIIESRVNIKNIEKYIIGILVFVLVGAIGAAVYFGINADEDNKKEEVLNNKKVIEVSNGQLKKITFEAGEEITLKTTSKIQKLKMETIDSTDVINKFLINGKEIYKNVLGGIDETVYIYNNIIIISDFGTDIRGNSLLFFDFNGNKIKEITSWSENKLLYWINGGIPDVADSYLVYVGENNNLIVEFPFTAVTHGPTITTTTNEVNEIVLDSKNNLEIIKDRLNISDETIIEGTAKMIYKGNGEFLGIEIVDGSTLVEYFDEMNSKDDSDESLFVKEELDKLEKMLNSKVVDQNDKCFNMATTAKELVLNEALGDAEFFKVISPFVMQCVYNNEYVVVEDPLLSNLLFTQEQYQEYKDYFNISLNVKNFDDLYGEYSSSNCSENDMCHFLTYLNKNYIVATTYEGHIIDDNVVYEIGAVQKSGNYYTAKMTANYVEEGYNIAYEGDIMVSVEEGHLKYEPLYFERIE